MYATRSVARPATARARAVAHCRSLLVVTVIVAAATGAITAPLAAQHGLMPEQRAHDPAIPTPRQVLGYDLGDHFTRHHDVARYFERIAAASPRVRLDTLGETIEGREVIMAVVTSAANHARLDQIRADVQRLAQPQEASTADLEAAIARTPAVAWMGYTVHGNEASGTEAALGLLYQLAAGTDAETQGVLDSVVVLIDPIQNPDGHERHVQYNRRMRGSLPISPLGGTMLHGGDWPGPRTSHYYFDLNRDWFIHSHPETRARVGAFLDWWPHVAVDLHEMGSNSTYFFAPPMEPVNKNVDPSIIRWWDTYAAANAAAFDERGWPFFRREGYDEFYPGYGVSWPILNGSVGMTYEQASSGGGAIRREDGTVLTLHDAAAHHYTAAWATLTTTADRRASRVRDYVQLRRDAITAGQRGGARAVVLARDTDGRADSLAARLVANGITVRRLTSEATLSSATAYPHVSGAARAPAGSYVVDYAQPQGRMARALLEPDAQLDSSFIADELTRRGTGQSSRFYDVTAWSLPYAFRVAAWTTSGVPAGTEAWTPAATAATRAAPARASHAYAVAPGSEASLRFIAGALDAGMRLWYAPNRFRAAGTEFGRGAFLVRIAGNPDSVHAVVQRLAGTSGAVVTAINSAMVEDGTDLGSNSVVSVGAPRVALLGGAPVNGNSFGFAWYALDQRLGYPTSAITTDAIGNGILREFDVLVVPSASGGGMQSALGDNGREQLQRWVREGGVLITLDGATGWVATEAAGLSRLRPLRAPRDTSSGMAPLPVNVPGAAVRAIADTLSPLLAGIRDRELVVLASGGSAYESPRDTRPGEVVVRLADAPRLRIAGYLWPEAPARLANSPWLWTERVGRGRVIAFAGDPNFRDIWRGLYPVFANAVLLGGSF